MEKYIQVLTTAGTKEDALKIAQSVVEKRLAGCVQVIGPITSTYWWEGKIEMAGEWLCLIKSREDLYKELEKTIQQIHPYKVPEILAVPVVEGSQSYLEWLEGELRKSNQ